MTLPVGSRAEELVPSREKIEAALAANHIDAVHLRKLKKMRDDLDGLAKGATLAPPPEGKADA